MCLKYWDVLPEDTRDAQHRERFFVTAPWWAYAATSRYIHGLGNQDVASYPSSTHACGCTRVARHPIVFHSLKNRHSMLLASCGLLGEAALGHEPLCRRYFDEPLEALLSEKSAQDLFGNQNTKWDGTWSTQ